MLSPLSHVLAFLSILEEVWQDKADIVTTIWEFYLGEFLKNVLVTGSTGHIVTGVAVKLLESLFLVLKCNFE